MEIWRTVQEFTAENSEFVIACAVVLFLLFFGTFLMVQTGRAGIFLAVSVMTAGGFALFALAYKIERTLMAYACAILLILEGGLYLLSVGILIGKEKRWERRARLCGQERELQYALPSRDNTFVRSRLNTVLRADYGQDGLPEIEQVDLGYAKKMLADVLDKPLSAGERIQAENIGKTLGVYFQKPRWSAGDLRTVNDALSSLMKICSKYSVSV